MTPAASGSVRRFLAEVARTPVKARRPKNVQRLIFALDATGSRRPLWDKAMHWQQAMFAETADLGGIAVQLCYFHGLNRFVSSTWHEDADLLLAEMSRVKCRTGLTQLERLLQHALVEAKQGLRALVYIGDAVEEDPEALLELGARLSARDTRLFLFQEGGDPRARQTFQRLAAVSRGAYSRFDQGSGALLRDLLGAAAVYAAGGKAALRALAAETTPAAGQLIRQLPD